VYKDKVVVYRSPKWEASSRPGSAPGSREWAAPWLLGREERWVSLLDKNMTEAQNGGVPATAVRADRRSITRPETAMPTRNVQRNRGVAWMYHPFPSPNSGARWLDHPISPRRVADSNGDTRWGPITRSRPRAKAKILKMSPTMLMKINRMHHGCPESPTMLLKTKGRFPKESDS
jgi:hypothetical protein